MFHKPQYKKSFLIAALVAITFTGFSQSLTPLTIGTIAPGDSVVIYYDVTINAGAGSQVSNQGTVSGSNFAAFSTDDPDTAPLSDPTITLLNVFPLPVTLYSLSAVQRNGGVEVAWNVAAESNLLKYEVERSLDGRSFSKIGDVTAQNNGQNTRYTFVDASVSSGTQYYRLKIVDRSATTRYSSVVKVDLAGNTGSVSVFPNPATQKQITLQLSNMEKGIYQLEIYNGAGQPVYRQGIQHNGGSLSRGFALPPSFTAGAYFVKIRGEKATYDQLLILK